MKERELLLEDLLPDEQQTVVDMIYSGKVRTLREAKAAAEGRTPEATR